MFYLKKIKKKMIDFILVVSVIYTIIITAKYIVMLIFTLDKNPESYLNVFMDGLNIRYNKIEDKYFYVLAIAIIITTLVF
jgi:hypothetical protein